VNYGHPLEFGTFITPQSADPEAAVALAKLSEDLGYDLVTFQDHPYQPALLDTWTLMSWVAGRTERIRIAANVLNIPLREPAVLGRAAASLDLLSGGRLELALGAGAFWDAIEAMGGPRRAPGEAVEAFEEAIDIVRGITDTSESAPLRIDGEFYRVSGAQRGPVPAHEIPIWIGAVKPRMLRLIGRKGDGWLPTLGYLKPGELRAGNSIIDEAAREVGRDPREIRRLVNISGRFSAERGGFLDGPSDQWVADLLPLVVEDGVGTFILMSDDPGIIERFAREVVPALRDAAERELGAFDARPIRRSSALAKRRDGIDYDAIPASLAQSAVEPGDVDYARVRSTYMRGGSPGLVLRPGNTDEVVEALAFARTHRDLPMAVRSGGHGISGRSTNDGGIVIDLSRLNAIEVLDRATRRVRIGPGARWMDVAEELQPYGWALTSGDYGGVGVGGLATAAGVGFLARKHGLTIDHLRAAEVVLADGRVVRASAEENPDLFWAIRGAGANFGIVTSFEFEVDEVGDVGWAQLVFDASDIAGFLQRWGAVVEAAPRDLTGQLIIGRPRRGQPTIAQTMTMIDSNQPETIIARLQPMANIAPLYDQSVVISPYAAVMANAQRTDHNGQGEPLSHSALIDHITPEFAAAAERFIRSGAVYFFQIRAVGGAVSDVDPDATAYGYRSANFSLAALGTSRRQMDPFWEELRDHFNGLYLSFETDRSIERLHDAFPPRTLERLRELKARYDPTNVFRDNFNIAPRILVAHQ
jgi:alkanesulfonate monooxygenase SsuD/methylene tetrahydromethanopterin reductase-like flavin-dependent oxidoreductase (luciferase family)